MDSPAPALCLSRQSILLQRGLQTDGQKRSVRVCKASLRRGEEEQPKGGHVWQIHVAKLKEGGKIECSRQNGRGIGIPAKNHQVTLVAPPRWEARGAGVVSSSLPSRCR